MPSEPRPDTIPNASSANAAESGRTDDQAGRRSESTSLLRARLRLPLAAWRPAPAARAQVPAQRARAPPPIASPGVTALAARPGLGPWLVASPQQQAPFPRCQLMCQLRLGALADFALTGPGEASAEVHTPGPTPLLPRRAATEYLAGSHYSSLSGTSQRSCTAG